MSARAWLVLVCVVWGAAGCRFDAGVPVGAVVSCVDDETACPPEHRCVTEFGRCVRLSSDDVPPTLELLSATPRIGGVGTRFTVRFRVNEPLLGAQVSFAVPWRQAAPMAVPAVVADGVGEAALEIVESDRSGPLTATVQVMDTSGNAASSVPVTLLVDRDGPSAVVAAVQYLPIPGGAVQPVRLGPGMARLAMRFDEPVTADVRLTATPDVLDVAPTDGGVLLRARPGVDVDGPVQLDVSAEDALGNRRVSHVPLEPALWVDTRVPGALGPVRFERAPHGTATSADVTQTLSGRTEPATVVRAVGVAGEALGRAVADADGGFVVPVALPDRETVRFDFTDEAGNVSPTAEPDARELVLTPAPVDSAAPAAVVEGLAARGPGFMGLDAVSLSGDVAARDDGAALEQRGGVSLRRRSQGSSAQGDCSTVGDVPGGRVLAFGPGARGTDNFIAFNGVNAAPLPQGPPPRSRAGLAVDTATSDLILFGGTDDSDVWVWNRRVWQRQRAARTDPPPRRGGVLVSERDGVLLLGGLSEPGGQPLEDAWTLRSGVWRALDAGALPLGRVMAGYDAVSRRVLVVGQRSDGGAAQTWWWDGDRFTAQPDAGAPSDGLGMLAFAPPGQRAYAVTIGFDAGQASWRYDARGWQRLATLPANTIRPNGMAWQAEEQRLVWCGTSPSALLGFTLFSPEDAGLRPLISANPGAPFGTRTTGLAQDDDLGEAYVLSGFDRPGDAYRWTPDAGWTRFAGNNRYWHQAWKLRDGGLVSLFGADTATASWRPNSEIFVDGGWQHLAFLGLSPDSVVQLAKVEIDGRLHALNRQQHWALTGTTWAYQGPTPFPLLNGAVWLVPPGGREGLLVGGSLTTGGLNPMAYPATFVDGGIVWGTAFPTPVAVQRSQMFPGYDRLRGVYYLYGGDASGSRWDGLLSEATWTPDAGLSVTTLDVQDPEGDGSPVTGNNVGGQAVLWWDPTTSTPQLYLAAIAEHWTIESAPNVPAVQLRFPYAAPAQPQRVVVRAKIGGTGVDRLRAHDPAGPLVDGARVLRFSEGRWVPVLDVPAPASAPAWGEATVPSVTRGELIAPGEQVVLRVEPLGANGRGRAQVVVDALELRLSDAAPVSGAR